MNKLSTRWHFIKLITSFFLVSLAMSAAADAAPYIPQNPSAVIETLPSDMPAARFASAADIGLSNPSKGESVGNRTEQISTLLNRAYLEGDPRALGQARAILDQTEEKDTGLLMLEARALQSDHQFEAAKTVLEQILKLEPSNPDALLILSSLLLVEGDFEQALELCTGLNQIDLMLYRLGCQAGVNSMTGSLESTKESLAALAQAAPTLDAGTARWIYLMQADAALRSQDTELAKQVFTVMDAQTVPALMARADWLLKHGEYARTIKLLKGRENQDALLLRLATAQLASCSPEAKTSLQLLGERIAVWEQRGENAHLREQATYELLRGHDAKALEVARDNWDQQRETADLLVYATAVLRTNSEQDLKTINQFIDQTGFEYPALTAQLKAGSIPSVERPSC